MTLFSLRLCFFQSMGFIIDQYGLLLTTRLLSLSLSHLNLFFELKWYLSSFKFRLFFASEKVLCIKSTSRSSQIEMKKFLQVIYQYFMFFWVLSLTHLSSSYSSFYLLSFLPSLLCISLYHLTRSRPIKLHFPSKPIQSSFRLSKMTSVSLSLSLCLFVQFPESMIST